MSNIIKEIEQSLSEVPPLKIDIKPVMQTAPAPDPLGSVKPVALPEAVPQPLPAPQPSAPIQAVPSTGSPVPEVPQVDALSYGDTISRMSAQSAAEIQKTIAASGTPKPNDVQNSLLNPNIPVQIDPKLSSQANPFAGNKAENAQERLAFEPPVLANGLANPFSDPNARAAIAAGISKEEYIAYIRDVKSKGEETTFGVPLQPNNLPMEVLQQQRLAASWQGLNAEQIRKKMAEKSGYLSARRNFNTSFLPFAGSENRNELETLFAALSFPANLVKGIGLDVLRPAAAVVAGGANIEEIKRAYEAMRPTKGGTFTGAAVLGQDFSSLAIADQKGAAFNPLAAVRDDKNLFQIALGFGLDILADPLNNDKVAELLFKPVGLFQRAKLPDVPTPPSAAVLSREIVPVVTEKYRQTPTRLVTSVAGDTPSPVRPQPDRLPTPNTPPRLEAPKEVVIEREVARTNELAVYKPMEVVFPEPRQPYTPIPDSRAIVPVPEVNLYNNVTALFNESDDLEVVQRFMRDVVEQKPYEQIPDARSLVVVQNPILREVAEFAQTGDLTPNIATLQGATVNEIADIVADRLELVNDTPLVVPKLQIQPIEIPQLDYSITSQIPRQRAPIPDFDADLIVSTESISTPVPKNLDSVLVDRLAQEMVSASDNVRPVVVERISPVEFKVADGGELQYAAAVRAAEIDPNFELRSVVVQKGTPQYEAIVRQEAAYKEIAKLSEDAVLVSTAKDTPTYTGTKTERELRTSVGGRTLDLESITTQRGGVYSTQAVNRMAESMLETGSNVRPIVVRRTSPTEFELIRGNLEYLAAKRAAEINPQFSEIRALIVDSKNEAAILRQLDILDEGIPVTTTKPVVVTESPFTSLSDLIDDARDGSIQSLTEVKNWSQKGDFVTKLKDIPNAVDDLDIDALNIPALMKVVKGRAGKLKADVVADIADALNKVNTLGARGDVAKSLLDALWRKSTDVQKQDILRIIKPDRLNKLGLERVETKITPPTLPTLRHEQAVMYHGAGSMMSKLDDSFYSTENIYGNGLYTTADRSVANSYRKKNATAYSKEGYLYSLTEKSPVKLFDLDKPLNLQSAEGKSVVEHLKRLQRSSDEYTATLADGALDELSQGLTVGKMMDNTRRFNEGGSEVLTDFIDSFREPLSKSGYGGYTHEGGVLTGSKRHQVNIYWKTEDVLELKQLEPAPDFSGSYHVVNDSRAELYELRKEMLLAQGYDKREAVMTAKRGHPISEEIENTGVVSDKSLELLVKNRELYSDYPSEQKWSSKMLQQIWEVATPEQKSYLMTNIDNIEKLGLERIARSNVIDDHLPIETEFDTPC